MACLKISRLLLTLFLLKHYSLPVSTIPRAMVNSAVIPSDKKVELVESRNIRMLGNQDETKTVQ